MTRLNLLRLNTVGAFDERVLADVSKLKTLSNQQLRRWGASRTRSSARRGTRGFGACRGRRR
jgi:hypothetical protein